MSHEEAAHQAPDPNGTLASDIRWSARCLSVIATAVIVVMLYVLRPVLAPFVVAVFLTVGLRPVLDVLQRYLRSRLAAVVIALLYAVAFLSLLGLAVGWSIRDLTHDVEYQKSAATAMKNLAAVAERFGLLPTGEPGSGTATANSPLPSVKRLQLVALDSVKSVQDWLLGGMVKLSGSLGVVLIYMFFLLLGASTAPGHTSEVWAMIEGKLREYIVLKTVISLGTGLAVWAVLAFFGVPLAILMGLLTFLLNYIPNFGPLVTCLLPLPLIWLNPSLNVTGMVLASLLACGVQLVGGNIIEPRMMGSSFSLHPIVVLLTLMIWFAIWGFVGMLLAVPITASLKVILERIDRTEPVARLMAGDLSILNVGDESAPA